MGELTTVTDSGPFWPAAAYSVSADQFLLLWVNVSDPTGWQLKARRIDAGTGTLLGSEFHISSDPATVGAIIGAVAFNAVSHEWFVVYQASINGGPDNVFAQRISSDGVKLGSHIPLVVKGGFQNAVDVAHDPALNRYLVVWNEQPGSARQIYGRLFDASGAAAGPEIRLSEVDERHKFGPRVAYNPVAQEYMAIWLDYRNWPGTGQDNNYGDVYGQRINPATGLKIGANIPIDAPLGPPYAPNGQDTPNGIACNPLDGRYAIGITRLTAALGWTTRGMVIDPAGIKVAPSFNLSHPSFGAQATPACDPASNSFFISYEIGSSLAGKEVSADGVTTGAEQAIIPGISVRDNVLAARPPDGLFLQFAITDSGIGYAQRFRIGPDLTAPAPITSFTATPGMRRITLHWINPATPDFTGTMIRSSTTGVPGGPTDGDLVTDEPGERGAIESFTYTGLVSGLTYYFAAFAHDAVPNYASSAVITGVPLYPGDFDADFDVDMTDFARLQLCLSGDANSYAPGCEAQDLDGDLDVDSADFGILQPCLVGAGRPPGC